MKKIIYLAVLLICISATAAAPPEVSEKVLKAFKETFTNAENVIWDEQEDQCQASFSQSEIQIRAVYDDDGNLLKTTRSYYEKNLPPNVLARLKKKYAGKEIFGITEVSTETEITYYVTLRDAKYFYKVEANAYGNSQQVEKFKRADIGIKP
jgi:hypothetical protein